jgi:hypothetical protein
MVPKDESIYKETFWRTLVFNSKGKWKVKEVRAL